MYVCLVALVALLAGAVAGVTHDPIFGPLIGGLSMFAITLWGWHIQNKLVGINDTVVLVKERDALVTQFTNVRDRLDHISYVYRRMNQLSLNSFHTEYAKGWRSACSTIGRALTLDIKKGRML